MSLIIKGGVTPFGLLLFLILAIYVYMRLARKKQIHIRRIAGLDAIEEVVGRAVEMGKPVHYSPGIGGVSGSGAPQTLAGITVLGYVASLTAKTKAKLTVSLRDVQTIPLIEETVRQAYLAEGVPEQYPAEGILWLSSAQFSFAGAVMARIRREKPAGNMFIGHLYAETLMLAETGVEIGAVQVFGTAAVFQIPFLLAACDYCLMGDEMFAADAYISKHPSMLASIKAIDFGKLFALLVIILGAILASFNIVVLRDLLRT